MATLCPESVSHGNPPSEFVEDDLPLPSFLEVFGFTVTASQPRLPSSSQAQAQNIRKRPADGENSRTEHADYVKSLKKRVTTNEANEDGGPPRLETGRWTPEEHKLFLEGVMLYGKDWKKMQSLIKTRSLIQIRTHAQKVFKKIGIQPQKKSDSSSNKGKISTATSQVQGESNYNNIVVMELSGSYRNYDMGEEVTDEEFNLVVQHLKSLGEMRGGDDLIEDEETEDQPPATQTQHSHHDASLPPHSFSSALNRETQAYHRTDYDPHSRLLSTRELDSTALQMAYNQSSSSSSYLPLTQSNSSYVQGYSIMDNADPDRWSSNERSEHTQQQQSRDQSQDPPRQQEQQSLQQLQEHDFSPSVTEEELHNHQLLQTLRQLMPDNFDQYSTNSTDFHASFGALDSNNHIGSSNKRRK